VGILTLMNYLEIFCCFCAGVFVGWLILARAPKWKRIIPDQKHFRGPNADVVYNGIQVEGEKYAFTDEALDVANQRAAKVWP
jgi:hypothetical protein